KKKMNKLQQSRNRAYCGYSSYSYEVSDRNGKKIYTYSEEEWREGVVKRFEKAATANKIEYLAFIFHDKDKNDDGQIKPLHFHFACRYKSPVVFHLANERLNPKYQVDNKRDEHFQVLEGAGEPSFIQYLLHLTAKAIRAKKHRYSLNDLYLYQVDDQGQLTQQSLEQKSEWFLRTLEQTMRTQTTGKGEKWNEKEEFIKEIEYKLRSGKISLFEGAEKALQKQFGEVEGNHIFLKRQKSFQQAVLNHIDAKIEKRLNRDSLLKTVYVYGPGGSGKSTLAAKILQEALDQTEEPRAFSAPTYAGNKTFDLGQGYQGEAVFELDDFSPYALGYDEFLKMFPRGNQRVRASVRNVNRELSVEYAVFTKAHTPGEFFSRLCRKELARIDDHSKKIDVLSQALDRINLYIEMTPTGCVLHRFNLQATQENKELTFETIHEYKFADLDKFRSTVQQKIVINHIFKLLAESEKNRKKGLIL
ncbi:TPA: Rep family protein, partial [Streptococcus suis]